MSTSWEEYLGGVSSISKLPIIEINVCITQSEEKYFKDHFWTNMSHQKGLFKKSYLICFINYQKECDYYSIGIPYITINFLSPNVY